MEKSLALTESFAFPAVKPAPVSLVSRELSFRLPEQNRVGSRLIVKGEMELFLLYMAEGENYPRRQVFTAPFSQILDLGSDRAACPTIGCSATAAYLNLGENIGGEKTMEAEVHALLQAVSREEETQRCYRDAYSNRMPLQCVYRTQPVPFCSAMERSVASTEELLPVSEDCADILSVWPALSREGEEWRADLEILFRTKNGELAAVRRSVPLRGDAMIPGTRLLSAKLIRCSLQPEGEGEVQAVESVLLEEDSPFDRASFPAVTLVRVRGESLWELARDYRSTVDAIEKMNEGELTPGCMLLIPRA